MNNIKDIPYRKREEFIKQLLTTVFNCAEGMGVVISPVDILKDSDELYSTNQLIFGENEVNEPSQSKVDDAIASLEDFLENDL